MDTSEVKLSVLVEAEEEAEEAEGVDNDEPIAGSVAGDAVAVIIGVVELRFAKKTPPDTAEDVDWVVLEVLEVLPLANVMVKMKDSSSVVVTSLVVVK